MIRVQPVRIAPEEATVDPSTLHDPGRFGRTVGGFQSDVYHLTYPPEVHSRTEPVAAMHYCVASMIAPLLATI